MLNIIIFLLGLFIVTIASNQISSYFVKLRLPIITGLLLTGIAAGPYFLKLLSVESIDRLHFVNDFSLAFIAFAAGSELYLKELRSSFKSIFWNTFGQFGVTFVLSAIVIYYISGMIPFMQDMEPGGKIAVSLLIATIFVARSPSSAIAIINEMRAKGPFVKTAISVTVIKDVLVIILFAAMFSLAGNLIKGDRFNFVLFLILALELILAIAGGYLLGKTMEVLLSTHLNTRFKAIIILLFGYSVYFFSAYVKNQSHFYLPFELHLEPLLICIVGGFYVTNFSRYRQEFQKILELTGPFIYAIFFTLTGASMSIDILRDVWVITLIFFGIRLISMMLGAYIGSTLAQDPPLFKKIGWMPYVTQAGVSIGLATQIAGTYEGWGTQFYTIILAVIVVNQVIGPPLFKIAINIVGEGHGKAPSPSYDGIRNAVIFGLENQSVALARMLMEHHWTVKIVCPNHENLNLPTDDSRLDIQIVGDISLSTIKRLKMEKTEAVVLMLSDEENYKICELLYEKIGTKEVIVRLQDHSNFDKFNELEAIVVDPSSAIVSLLDHAVRSPNAISLLMGNQDDDTVDLEVMDKSLHGVLLRELRLPSDVIVLAVKRKGELIISHGYTRLRMGDVVTMVGSRKSLEKIEFRFDPAGV